MASKKSRGAPQVEYQTTTDIRWLLNHFSFNHLSGKYLTEERISHAAFVITANMNGVAVGIIIGEYPWGKIGQAWNRNIPRTIQVGGLFVSPEVRGNAVAYRLGELAVMQVLSLERTPVAVTENGSPTHRFVSRMRAQKRRPFMHEGQKFTPWNLAPAAKRHMSKAQRHESGLYI